jgi:hypothetical protein
LSHPRDPRSRFHDHPTAEAPDLVMTPLARPLRSSLVLLAFGAVAGTLLDALHTHSGTTVYANVWCFEMSAWTPLIFALAGLSVGLSYPLAERITGRRPGRVLSWAQAWTGFGLFAGLYAASGYLPASNVVKLVVLTLVLAATTAIVGPLVEASLVRAGFFSYTQPDILGVAMWLPSLYAAGSVAFGGVGYKLTL